MYRCLLSFPRENKCEHNSAAGYGSVRDVECGPPHRTYSNINEVDDSARADEPVYEVTKSSTANEGKRGEPGVIGLIRTPYHQTQNDEGGDRKRREHNSRILPNTDPERGTRVVD